MKTYILIQSTRQAERDRLARQVREIPGVAGVDAVTGPYDLIAEVGGDGAGSVLARIGGLDGVLRAIDAPVVRLHEAA